MNLLCSRGRGVLSSCRHIGKVGVDEITVIMNCHYAVRFLSVKATLVEYVPRNVLKGDLCNSVLFGGMQQHSQRREMSPAFSLETRIPPD